MFLKWLTLICILLIFMCCCLQMFLEWTTLICILLIFVCYLFGKNYLLSLRINHAASRYVFITGCDTGFGNLLAKLLDSKGVIVIAGCLTTDGASNLQSVTSSRLKTVILDVSDEKSVAKAFRTVTSFIPANTGLWGLVNNAGIMPNYCPAELTTLHDYRKVCDVNLFGSINMTLRFLPLLRKANGRIVNVCSVVASVGMTGTASYSISKSALRMFTTCLRRELFKSGISVHSIEPGGFKTAVTNMERLERSFRDSYYNASPELQEVYGGNIGKQILRGIHNADPWICASPQLVADAMEHAILGRFPKLRYLVGPDIYFFFGPLMYLPEWLVDYVCCWPKPYGKTCIDLQTNGPTGRQIST